MAPWARPLRPARRPTAIPCLVGDTGLTYAPTIYPKAGFDFARDFAPISAFGRVPYVLVINPARLDVPNPRGVPRDCKEEARRDRHRIGRPRDRHASRHRSVRGTGWRPKLNHVPYRGGAPMLQDLLAGQIGAAFVLVSAAAGHVKSGKLRALAVASRRREALMPEVPTAHEAGLADFRMTIWFGLFAPARTPDAILDRLHGAVQEAIVNEGVKRLWREQGAKVEPESRADFARFVARDTERWSRIAKAANVQME